MLNVEPEKSKIITVAGQRQVQRASLAATTTYNPPPLIVIAFPKNNKRVASASEVLAGVVADDLGLERWWSEPDYIVEAREKGLVG